MSDTGFDAAGTGLKDGLVLRNASNGPWQQWYPQANGTLRNAATGLVISPERYRRAAARHRVGQHVG